jgi:hypothetical protein
MDIENAEEYRKFVKKHILLEKSSARPKKILVWFNIEEVKCVFKTVHTQHSSYAL